MMNRPNTLFVIMMAVIVLLAVVIIQQNHKIKALNREIAVYQYRLDPHKVSHSSSGKGMWIESGTGQGEGMKWESGSGQGEGIPQTKPPPIDSGG